MINTAWYKTTRGSEILISYSCRGNRKENFALAVAKAEKQSGAKIIKVKTKK